MKGDFSRKTFDPKKHYTQVLMQQGRVQVDADWNEQQAIHQYRTETEARDVIGKCGVPKTGGGFRIDIVPNGSDLTISPGRIYVEGILCELEATPISIEIVEDDRVRVSNWFVDGRDFQQYQWVEIVAEGRTPTIVPILDADRENMTLTLDADLSDFSPEEPAQLRRIATYITQPDDFDPENTTQPEENESRQLNLENGTYLVYLDVWQRHLTALDDPRIREIALGDPDTTTRLKTVCQVKLLSVRDADSLPIRDLLESLKDGLERFGRSQFGTNRDVIIQAVAKLEAFIETSDIDLEELQTFLGQLRGFLSSRFESFSGDPQQFFEILSRIEQIREIIAAPETLTCNSPFPAWDNLTAPPTGTLNARTQTPSDPENPCLLPPTAGYQRLENQLYRVEIHQRGSLGTATFKWSRDNGSVVTNIEEFSSREVTVRDVGPDDVLGFANGQWVEITDDRLELSGQPGELLQISDVNPATRVILLSSDPTPLTQNPKLRRWEGDGESLVEIPTANDGWIRLEGGVEVKFAEGEYETGDYWLIPARTATGEVEWPPYEIPNPNPIPQLPFGIQHYYCRLALIRFDGEQLSLVQDCRRLFPPLTELEAVEGCCTVVVHPEDDIQTALDSLSSTGGCVCLKTGTHMIAEPLRIEKSNIVLQGESPGTRVLRRNGINLLAVSSPAGQTIADIVVERIQFVTTGVAPEVIDTPDDLAIAFLQNCTNVIVKDCNFSVVAATGENATIPALALLLYDTRQVKFHDNQIQHALIGVWGEGCTALEICRNAIAASTVTLGNFTVSAGYIGVLLDTTAVKGRGGENCRIEENRLENYWMGVSVGAIAPQASIRGNHILRPALPRFPENLQELAPFPNEPYFYGIISLAPGCTLSDNTLDLNSPIYGGIRVLGLYSRIEGNNILGSASSGTQYPIAIVLSPIQQQANLEVASFVRQSPLLPDRSIVQNNILLGSLYGIFALNPEGVQLLNNRIEGLSQQSPAIAIGLGNTHNTRVEGNQIQDAGVGIFLNGGTGNQLLTNHLSDGGFGISATAETDLEVSGNAIDNMKVAGVLGTNLLLSARVARDRITHCGYEGLETGGILAGAGIFIASSFVDLCVESCEVLNAGVSREGESHPNTVCYGIAAYVVPVCRIARNAVGYNDPAKLAKLDEDREHRALYLLGLPGATPFGLATVTDNVFTGLGQSYLVEIFGSQLSDRLVLSFEKVTFSNNTCEHFSQQTVLQRPNNPATVSISGKHAIVMGNHIKEPNIRLRDSIKFDYFKKLVFMGNVTTYRWNIPAPDDVVPTNFSDFNTQVG
jgi:parallel beta-helix repeat protein